MQNTLVSAMTWVVTHFFLMNQYLILFLTTLTQKTNTNNAQNVQLRNVSAIFACPRVNLIKIQRRARGPAQNPNGYE